MNTLYNKKNSYGTYEPKDATDLLNSRQQKLNQERKQSFLTNKLKQQENQYDSNLISLQDQVRSRSNSRSSIQNKRTASPYLQNQRIQIGNHKINPSIVTNLVQKAEQNRQRIPSESSNQIDPSQTRPKSRETRQKTPIEQSRSNLISNYIQQDTDDILQISNSPGKNVFKSQKPIEINSVLNNLIKNIDKTKDQYKKIQNYNSNIQRINNSLKDIQERQKSLSRERQRSAEKVRLENIQSRENSILSKPSSTSSRQNSQSKEKILENIYNINAKIYKLLQNKDSQCNIKLENQKLQNIMSNYSPKNSSSKFGNFSPKHSNYTQSKLSNYVKKNAIESDNYSRNTSGVSNIYDNKINNQLPKNAKPDISKKFGDQHLKIDYPIEKKRINTATTIKQDIRINQYEKQEHLRDRPSTSPKNRKQINDIYNQYTNQAKKKQSQLDLSQINKNNQNNDNQNSKIPLLYKLFDNQDLKNEEELNMEYRLKQNKIQQIHDNMNAKKKTETDDDNTDQTTQLTVNQDYVLSVDYQSLILMDFNLFQIMEGLKQNKKIHSVCRDYLNLISHPKFEFLDNVIVGSKQQMLKLLIVYERMVIITTLYFTFQEEQNIEINMNLINLMYFVCQNFTFFLQFLIKNHNFSQDNENSKIKILEVVSKKLSESIVNVDKNTLINKNNEIIHSILSSIINQYLPKEPFKTISNILQSKKNQTIGQITQDLLKSFSMVIPDIEQKLRNKNQITEQVQQSPYEDSDEELELVDSPYLPALPEDQYEKQYTLVLDLDETLVHYQDLEDGCGQFLVRPYAESFLEEMSKYYELVIFTAALKDYADWIIEKIDPNNKINYRLYRQHCVPNGKTYIKDLDRIGRNVNKTIIIDNLAENFQNQPENGIFIHTWTGEPDDRALEHLTPILKEIVKKQFNDVKIALRRFRDQMLENISNGIANPHLYLQLE